MKYWSFILFLLGFSTLLNAQQLNTVSFDYNPILKKAAKQLDNKIHKNGNFLDTIALPFIDDFSYNGPYPDTDLWLDNSVYINSTFAIDAPTIGVATFDGANYQGAPYANSGQGSADTLTSTGIKLAGKDASSNINLSFFYEPKGYGDKPGSNDKLMVEFKDNNDTWVEVWSYIDTSNISDIPTFNFVTISINDNSYFYDGFQFRFRNEATFTGFRDMWHVDYVRVTEGQTPSTTLDDVAFNKPPISILGTYTEMPWAHFKGFEADELDTQSEMNLYNHFNSDQNVRPARYKVNSLDGVVNFDMETLDFGSAPINGNITKGVTTLIDSVMAIVEYNSLLNDLKNYNGTSPVTLDVQLNITPANEQNSIVPVARNNAISREIVFDNYFSYDDGTAETAVAAGRIGDQFAVKYHANVADSLKAIQINLPRLSGNITNQRINLKVWIDDIDGTPAYQRNFVKAVYVDTVQSWTTYSLDSNALLIPAGSDFYIGWQQATTPPTLSTSFLIGYDRNTTKGFSQIFQNVGAGWEKLDTVTIQPPMGSIMIRPIVGNGEYFSTSSKEIKTEAINFRLYPNPTRNQLTIELANNDFENYEYQIFNTTGVLMQADILSNNVNVSDLSNGLYIIRLRNTTSNVSEIQKFMILK
jgi:hypothetical protein